MRLSPFRLSVAIGATLLTFTSAEARQSPAPRGLILTGTITEGDAPNRFTETIDLKTGASKQTKQMGNSESQSGFDRQPWEAANGIVMATNLPSAVAVQRARAWLASVGWQQKGLANEQSRHVSIPGAAPIELTFDPATKLLAKATIAGDWGPEVLTYGDWRKVGRFNYPFHRADLSSVGEHTVMQVESARLVPFIPKGRLARPVAKSHAQLAGNHPALVPFASVGAKSTYILVGATINDRPVKIIFDTGAANYVTTEAAPYLDIKPTGGINLSGVGETSATGGYATIDKFAFGDAALRDETIVVGPPPWPPTKGKPPEVAGATGFEFFAEYVTTIDYPGNRLIFARSLPKAPGAVRVRFYNDGFHMYVPATIDGVEGLFGLDTGDGSTVTIFPTFAARHRIQGASGEVASSGAGLGGDVKSQPGLLKRFSLGGLNFDQLPVNFSHNKGGAFASKTLAGNLGGGVLRCYRITIDFPHHLLLFDPAPTSPTCTPGGTVSRS